MKNLALTILTSSAIVGLSLSFGVAGFIAAIATFILLLKSEA